MPMMKYLTLLGLSFVLFGGTAHAEFTVQPSLTVGEEYNDNIFLQKVNPQFDYITEVLPSITAHYQSPLWTWDGNYTLQYLYYDIHHSENQSNPTVFVRNLTDLWSTVLYFEGIEDYRRVSTSVVTNFTTQSPIVNQSDQNMVTLHPYISVKPFQSTTWETGYRFIDTRYSHGSGIDRIDNIVYFTSTSDLSSRLTFTVGASATKEQNDVNRYTEYDIYTGLRYLYAENSFIFGMVTRSWYNYEGGENQDYWGWNGGVTHHIAEYTIKLETGSTPIPDPSNIGTREDYYRATISRDTARSNISVAYTYADYINSQIDQTTSAVSSVQAQLTYRFTPRLSGTASWLYQDTNDKASASYIYLSQTAVALNYNITEKLSMQLAYTYINSYAPVLTNDDYRNNQAGIQFKYLFY